MKKLSKIIIVVLVLLGSIKLGISQSHYPGQHTGKFAIEDNFKPAAYSFDLQDVKLLDSRFRDNMVREQQWLLQISTTQLLHSFRTNAGIYDANEGGYFDIQKLGGWESLDCELRGHSTGHILSGLALMYASTGDVVYKQKADSIVSGLADVQTTLNQNGYLSAFPQELINRNMAGKKVWAPWYTLHKIFNGLIDQYLYSDNTQALDIVKGMSNWAYNKLKGVSNEQRALMLRNEFGGINESFYNLYSITGNKNDKWLAEFFYHNDALDPLKKNSDILEKKHANTYIPKLLGLVRNYEIEGNGDGNKIASFFWNTVVNHHSFVTGSNSDKEKFFKPDNQSEHLTGYTGESCNVYNMLKLTKHLFSHTTDVKYADYYERALYNHILGQQDPQSGMISYFLPMLAGAHKVYSTPIQSFWCCVGTGFENQAKYGEGIYYHTNNSIYINLYIPSELNWKARKLSIKQESKFPQESAIEFTVNTAPLEEMEIKFRYPIWATNGCIVKINGKPLKVQQMPGSYISIKRKWKMGDKILIDFPMGLYLAATNDNPNKAAVMYGPLVLAGDVGNDGFKSPAPFSNPQLYNDYYTYNYNVPSGITTSLTIDNAISNLIVPVIGEPNTFKVLKENITLRPLFDIHRSRYVVYWDLNRK
jgi:DUF1680 family protein